ncbi:MAG: outer membrane beta-barrel protein [Candidatus Omnitrophota bacterium]
MTTLLKKQLLVWIVCAVFASTAWAAPSPVKVKGSAVIGFDNNPGLNADREDDFFAKETAKVSFKQPLFTPVKARLAYDVLNVNYFEQSEEDLLMQRAGAGLDVTLDPRTVLETDYGFRYVLFHQDDADDDRDRDDDLSTYWRHETRAGLRHRMSDAVVARAGVGAQRRDYEDRMARQASGVLFGSEERSDDRYLADSEVVVRVAPRTFLRGGFNFYQNDSNDQFHDTYDYDSYEWFAGVRFSPFSKTTLSFKFSYENRDYDSRVLLDDATVFQEDDIYRSFAGAYYKFNRNVSLGLTYTYRQRNSNEPTQSYSGSLATAGFYINF